MRRRQAGCFLKDRQRNACGLPDATPALASSQKDFVLELILAVPDALMHGSSSHSDPLRSIEIVEDSLVRNGGRFGAEPFAPD